MKQEKQEANITILVVPHDGPMRVETIPNELAVMQKLVEGYIEVFPVGVAGAVGLCNEEGIMLRLPLSRVVPALGHPVFGSFIVVGDVPPEFGSLSDEQIAQAREVLGA